MRYAILAALAATLGSAASAHATQFVVNGDFTELSAGPGEIDVDTTVTGWSGNGGYNFVFANANDSTGTASPISLWTGTNGGAVSNTWNGLTASGAGNFAAMDGDYITEPLTQTITGLTVGDQETITFYYAGAQQDGFTGATTEGLTVSFGNDSDPLTTLDNVSHGFTGWQEASVTFTASSTSEVLSFLANGTPNGEPPMTLLDGVSISQSPVPEPGTLTLLGTGILGLGGMVRRRFLKA